MPTPINSSFPRRLVRAAMTCVLFFGAIVSLPANTKPGQMPPRTTPAKSLSLEELPPGLAPVLARSMAASAPAEYQIHRQGAKHVSSNRAHALKLAFSAEEMQIEGQGWTWGMALKAWGRESLEAVPSAKASVSGTRLEYRRGPLTEWYLNSEMGLEQGFTVHARPEGRLGKLALELALKGSLQAMVSDTTNLSLVDPANNREKARYGGLLVVDADGKALPASFVLSAKDTLRILIDDRHARYPVTIDPWLQRARLTGSDSRGCDSLGYAVAADGDTVVVGAYKDGDHGTNAGAAFVFVKPGTGWANATEAAKLTASDGAPGDNFGMAVAVHGDTVVVGAQYAKIGSNVKQGAAYIFVKPTGGWSGSLNQAAKIDSVDGLANYQFASSVAIKGSTLAVGSSAVNSVYIFTGSGGTWTRQVRLNGADVGGGAGAVVAVSDDEQWVAAGAPTAGSSEMKFGDVYVYNKPGAGWSAHATTLPDATLQTAAADRVMQAQLGISLATRGNVIVAGAPKSAMSAPGVVCVYVKPGTGWSGTLTPTATLKGSDTTNSDLFGESVAISGSGDMIAIGTWLNQEKVYIYKKPAGGWADDASEDCTLSGSDHATYPFADFGYRIAMSGDTLVSGAYSWGGQQGAAYVFTKPAGGWVTGTENALLTASDGGYGDSFGFSVATDETTAVVGAYYNNGRKGSVFVYSRPSSGWADAVETAKLTASDGVLGDGFGYAVGISGGTIVASAYSATVGSVQYGGKAYVFLRPSGGWVNATEDAMLIPSDGIASGYFGTALGISGDTVVVSMRGATVGSNTRQGALYVFTKPGGGWSGSLNQTAKLWVSDGTTNDYLGMVNGVAISGDTIVVGTYRGPSTTNQGRALVFVKPGGGWVSGTQSAELRASDAAASCYFGRSVSISGDTIAVGATGAPAGSGPGQAYVFVKPLGGWQGTISQSAILTPSGGVANDNFGYSIAVSGNTVAVGANQAPYDAANATAGPGAVYCFSKPSGGWANEAKSAAFVSSAAGGDKFGAAAALSRGTLLVGVPGERSSQGAAYILSGPIVSGNAGVGGPLLSLGGDTWTMTADASGNYLFLVPDGWTDIVTPSKTGYTFSPVSRSYSGITTDQSGQDYAATAITYTLSGNAGVGNATMSYDDGGAKTAMADETGAYSFTVSYNWSGSVTPSRAGYTFNPASIAYTNVLANQSGQNYSATGHTLISLTSFTAQSQADRVVLSWQTGSELDTAGFHIWRSSEPNGTYARITPSPIPSMGTGLAGATYAWSDTNVNSGQTWFYKLEDLDTSGLSTFHGPVSATLVTASPILRFQAAPGSVFRGGSTVLNWTVTGNPVLSIVGIGVVTGSGVKVTPMATTSYVLSDGQGHQSLVTVNVKAFALSDMAGLSKAWGSAQGEAAFDPSYDLDGDGRVDDTDVALCFQGMRSN